MESLAEKNHRRVDVLAVELISTLLTNPDGAECYFVVRNKENQQLFRSWTTKLEKLLWTGETFEVSKTEEQVIVDFIQIRNPKVQKRLKSLTLTFNELFNAV